MAERIDGLDAGRIAAFFAVVMIHHPLPQTLPNEVLVIWNQAARFGVPFFFVLAGYLMGPHLSRLAETSSYVIRRIVPAYLFWLAAYNWHYVSEPTKIPSLLWLIDGGDGLHLWYLWSVAACLVVASGLLRIGTQWLFGVSLISYLCGLYLAAYSPLLHGPDIPVIGRDGIFVGLAFVAIGWFLRSINWRPSVFLGAACFLTGGLLQIAEGIALGARLTDPIWAPHTTLATILFGTGAFVFFLSLPSNRVVHSLALVGRFTLGAYAVHVFILRNSLLPLTGASASGAVLDIAITAVVSYGIAAAAAQASLLRFAFK